MDLDANKDLIRRFADVINAADWDGLDDLLAEDFTRHSQATSEMQEMSSREEFKLLQQGFLASFPDQRTSFDMLVAEGDMVAGYGTYSGTNLGPMGDIPPTGKRGELKVVGFFRIEGGKIAELWVEWDNVAFLTQLGLMP